MGKQTIIESVKEWLAGICWHLFLWLNNLTENEYFRQIKEQELQTDESRPLDALVSQENGELDRYVLGDAIRLAYLELGNDSWCSIADKIIKQFNLSRFSG